MEILTLFKTAAKMIFQLSWILSKAMVLLIVSLQVPFAKASQQHQQKIIWNLTHLAWSSTLVVRRCLSFGVSHHTSKSDFLLFILSSQIVFYYLFYQVISFCSYVSVGYHSSKQLCFNWFFIQRCWFDKFQLVVIIQYFINHIKIFDILPLP